MRFACRVATATGTHSEYLVCTIENSSTNYSIACKQRKGNPFLHFCGNSEHFFTLLTATSTPTIIKKETYCCVSMATVVMRTRHNVTYCTNMLSFSRLRYIESKRIARGSLRCVLVCLMQQYYSTKFMRHQ